MRILASLGGVAAAATLVLVQPSTALACACGCGIFGVGTLPLVAPDLGGMAFLEYDYMDQNQNWSGSSQAPSQNNSDKEIRTDFYTAGGEYMFDGGWGVMAEVPFWQRHFLTTGSSGDLESFDHDALGDVRIEGIYNGFTTDGSTGVVFGLKLPTGDSTYPNFDRDTEIGTGSLDTLLGAYHAGSITSDNAWAWFVQGQWQHAVTERDQYRPGDEIDGAVGVDYAKGMIWGQVAFTPTMEFLVSQRAHDSGTAADPPDSGYTRFFAAPGIEMDYHAWKVFGAIEVPVVQHFNGNQLAAGELFKLSVGYAF